MSDDARQIIVAYNAMGVQEAASQATILRSEDLRIRHVVLTGVTDDATDTTRVFLKGVTNPVMLNFDCMFEAADSVVDAWVGKEYQVDAGSDTFAVVWFGPGAPANKNSFQLTVSASLQAKRYRIFCTYCERI